MRLLLPRALGVLIVLFVVVGTWGCCQSRAVDMVLDVAPPDRQKTCEEICGAVITGSDIDSLAECVTSKDGAEVICTFSYTECPQELL